jgi:ABC-type branched-subunit amino acid transport system substrate-binding protein
VPFPFRVLGPRALGPRALASSGVACLAALAVAGCATTGSGSSSSSGVTVSGHTLTIYISEPRDMRSNPVAQDIVRAEQMAFLAHRKEVTDYKLKIFQIAGPTFSYNARTAIETPSTIAYLGELAPGASDETVGITNAVDVLQVSPTDNALELTDSTPAVSGGFKSFYESYSTYGRTFARVVPSASEEARAQVAEMKALGVTKLYVANDGSDYGKAIADAVRSDASAAGLTLSRYVGEEDNGYFYGAASPADAAKFFNHIASMAPTAKLFGPSSLNSSAFTSAISGAVRNLYVSIPGYLPKDLPAAGKSFVSDFKAAYHHAPNVEAVFGYEAMSALLRVLKNEGENASDRTDVVKGFMKQRKVSSVLGTYSIDSSGNTSLDAFVFARLHGGKLVPFAAAPRS